MNIPKPVVQIAGTIVMSAIGTLASMATSAVANRIIDDVAAEQRRKAAEHVAGLEAMIETLQTRLRTAERQRDVAHSVSGRSIAEAEIASEDARQLQEDLHRAREMLRTAGLSTGTELQLAA